jgi:hypothetical protein
LLPTQSIARRVSKGRLVALADAVGYRAGFGRTMLFLPLCECVQVALVARRFRMSIRHNGFCIVIHLGQVAQVDRV